MFRSVRSSRFMRAALLVTVVSLTAACSSEGPGTAGEDAATAAPQPQGMASAPGKTEVPEVVVLAGLEGLVGWLENENWWGEPRTDEPLSVPRIIFTGIEPRWQVVAADLPVQMKKAIFYRLMGPLVLHANQMVRERRARLVEAREALARDGALSAGQFEALKAASWMLPADRAEVLLGVESAGDPLLGELLNEMIYRVDEVPAGLALGQAAYESGYGTSRFAVEGNSLFGQWTWGGDGIVPGEQRKSKGDHRIAAFDWPFDSVRGYFLNLMTHPAYEDFRRLRAEARAEGRPLSSLELADGLLRYSERGQDYVDSLKGMIRHNHLEIADTAVLRDEPMRFILVEADAQAAEETRERVAAARESGELAGIFERMRLE